MALSQQISVNFFPLEVQDFEFTVYRTPYNDSSSLRPEGSYKYSLPQTTDDAVGKYTSWWVSFAPLTGFTEFYCKSHTNQNLTCRFLHELLVANSNKQLA